MIEEDLVFIDLEARNREEVIGKMAGSLVKKGYVTDGFVEAVLERECKFPTGLPSAIPVAIPHEDAKYCKRSALAVATLKEPVAFREMGNPENELPVRLVFLFALNDPDMQVTWLQKLSTLLGCTHFLERVLSTTERRALVMELEKALGKGE
ncbi:MAG: PTS sugar transporter subunit IIA [Chloroflexi bacterium]|nr:PTS sugar transporter subunit IIA [Chloroflexota bacterium]